ncbi:transient receptor potential cation channel [Echinococcus multilocularis]|uniref:Transient receptor potential cation channel n=1 Tax=Echinococcus multilocularis TaxID=6211 RepID=A0A087W1Q5_ECHMU|nr:transient receptor potential cation channel [Echinococcus multilocularis]
MGDYVGVRKLLVAGLPYLTQDRANELPLAFCKYHQSQAIKEYIMEVTNAQKVAQSSDDVETDIENDEVQVSHNRRTLCECSDDVAKHEKFSESEVLNELIASRSEVFVKQPTNTFGQFETPCSNLVAEFVRIADDTPVDNLAELFFGIWKMRKPDLALTLYGSVPQQKSFQKRFNNMIFSIFQKTLTWVITDGIYDSVAETMSHGIRGYAEAYGLTKLQVIGIVPWRRMSFQADLHSADFSGNFQARFPDRERKLAIQTQIAPFHTRYLFIDSGARNDVDCIQNFRTQFEVWLSKIRLDEESFELSRNIPLCGLLVAGRPEDALGVYQALCRNIPFVVVADSGGLASILERCVSEMEYLQGSGNSYTDDGLGEIELDETESSERVLEIMFQYWTEEEIQQESLDMVLKIVAYSQLIEFFSSDKGLEGTLDRSILSSLINPALFQTQESQYTWKPRLKIALELDRSGFVLEKILDGAKWTPKEMEPFVISCLLKNKVDFLRIFTDVGFEMHEFANTKIVEELYSVEAQRNTLGGASLREFLLYYEAKVPAQITIERVRKTLQKLMGHNLLTYNKENPKPPGAIRRTLRGGTFDYKSKRDHCIQYLYLWALVTRRFETAHFLLTMLTDISAGALFAATFLRCISKKTRFPSDSMDQRRYASEFEQLAVSILDACYFNNKENTMNLLVMERRSFAMHSCMMIASEGNCREFMQHRACQEYLDRVWANTLLIKKLSGRFILSIVVGAVFPPAVPFVAEYDEAMYDKSAKSRKAQINIKFNGKRGLLQRIFTRRNCGTSIVHHAFGMPTNLECANITTPGCTYPGYRVLIPLLMAIFTLTTHVLLINLLIAIFTKTYDRMVAISQQLWTMQRYRLVEYILVGSVQPGPFLIFSFVYQLAALFCRSKTSNKSNKKRPFRKSFEDNPGRERQLINWEKLSALVMMGMHDEGQELERASKGGVTLENRRKAMESWKTPNDRSWQIVRRIVPPTMALQSLAKPGPVTDDLAKKIDDIDSKLEKISTLISGRPVESKVLLPSNVKPSSGLSREGSRRSSLNSIDISDVPIVAQWLNHQIAIYSSLTSDTTPHTLDPPIPWEMPYPKYRAIPWSPRRFMVPQWQGDSMPPPEAFRLHSFDSTNLSFCDSAPRNPEGRVGTAGKGLLPKYGANSACIIVVARGSISDEVLVLKGIRPQAQFPWFLCTHPPSCNQTTCFNGLVQTYCQKCQNSETEQTKKAVIDDFIASFVQCIEIGSTSDPINCDNAWLSVTAIHFQIPPNYKWISDLENILAVKDSTPSWVRTDNLPALRRSHLAALMAIKQ